MISFDDLRLNGKDLEGVREKIESLKTLAEELSMELDNLAARGEREKFPKEASFIPVAKRQIRKWEEILRKRGHY